MRVGFGIFFSVLTAIVIYMIYEGVSMVWRHQVGGSAMRYFLSSIIIIFPLLTVFLIGFFLKSTLFDAKAFSESYKSEALIEDIVIQSFSRGGTYADFGLVLEIKNEKGPSYKTKILFQTPVRYKDYFKVGKTIIVDVSAADPNKVRVSDDTYK